MRGRPRRHRLVAILVLTGGLVGASIPAVLAQPASEESQANRAVSFLGEPACVTPPGTDAAVLRDLPAETQPDESPAIHKWLETEQAQSAVNRINEVLDARTDVYLGAYIDFLAEEFIVVVDANAATDPTPVIDELRAATQGGLTVIVRPSCRPKAEIDAVVEEIKAGAWQSSDNLFLITVNEATGRVHVRLQNEDAADASRLVSLYGDAVEVTVDLSLASRMADGSPHYGGAAIGQQGQSPYCTASFAMDKAGGRWMATANHCDEGNPYNSWYSGANYYGAQTSAQQFPLGDTMLLVVRR